MARIRSIHPGLFTDEAFVQLSCDAQMFLVGLWTEADDQGVFEWKPITLRMRLRPTKDGPVETLLEEMAALNIIRAYEIAGRKLGAIRNFRKWQKPKTPNAIHLITDEIRNYTGLTQANSEMDGGENVSLPQKVEIDTAERDPFPQKGEKSLLMEDGGGKREEGRGRKTISAFAENESPEPSLAESLFQNPTQSQNPSSTPKENIPARPRRAAAKRPLPDDWGLDPHGPEVAYALAKGMKIEDVRAEAENFRNHHRAKGSVMADWNAAWRTWAGNWQKFNQKGQSHGRQNHPNRPSKTEQIDAAARAGLTDMLAPLARRAGYETDGGTSDGYVQNDERFREGAGIIEGDFTVLSD